MMLTFTTQIAKFMGPTWGPPGSCGPQMGPMLTPWSFLLGYIYECFITFRCRMPCFFVQPNVSTCNVGPCGAEYYLENMKNYLRFLSFFNIEMVQMVVEIFPYENKEPFYQAKSMPCLLVAWRRKKPGHQHSRYWPSSPWIFRFRYQRGWFISAYHVYVAMTYYILIMAFVLLDAWIIPWTNADFLSIGSNDNGSTRYWPSGSLYTLGAGGHI